MPHGDARASIVNLHFPDRVHEFVWRNWNAVEPAKLARILGATAQQITAVADSMGLPGGVSIPPELRERGYITLIRRNWHLLPYEQLLELLEMTPVRARLSIKTYLMMILVKLLNHYTVYRGNGEVFDVQQRRLERLRPLFNFLDQHFSEPIALGEAAAIVNMSQSHFLHFFKRVTGQSFVNYLNQFRVARAQALLASSEKTIAEVSQEVGFCDQSYFGQVFRKFLPMTPREYKAHLEGSKHTHSCVRDPKPSDC